VRACRSLGVARATLYRQRARAAPPLLEAPARPAPPLKLTAEERDHVLTILHSERFVDASPHTIHATLLDEGQYPCSVRMLYRILAAENELRERRVGGHPPIEHGGHGRPAPRPGHRAAPDRRSRATVA